MKWFDIKLATLQKITSADGSTIPSDESTSDYIAAMPYAANEAIQMLSTAGKYLIKSLELSVDPQKNLLGDMMGGKIYQVVKGTKPFTASNVHSFYFEFTGKGTVTVKCVESLTTYTRTFNIDSKNKFTAYGGTIQNPNNINVTLEANSDYPYSIKNVALYEANYENDNDVIPYAEKIRYNLKDLASDFHSVSAIYFEGDADNTRYVKTDEVYKEGDKVIALDRDECGRYVIYYNALPEVITTATEDNYELPLDREVAPLIPLYIASQIYKDDNIAIATTLRNEFEVAFERLQMTPTESKAERLESESGWI